MFDNMSLVNLSKINLFVCLIFVVLFVISPPSFIYKEGNMEKAVVYPIMRFNKKLRDPNAPRRNMSTYLLYQNAMRETFKEQVGTSYSLQPSSVYSFLNHPQYFPCHIPECFRILV